MPAAVGLRLVYCSSLLLLPLVYCSSLLVLPLVYCSSLLLVLLLLLPLRLLQSRVLRHATSLATGGSVCILSCQLVYTLLATTWPKPYFWRQIGLKPHPTTP